MAFKLDFIVTLFAGALAETGKAKLLEVLQDLHDSNIDDYKGAILGGWALVKHIHPITLKSKNKVDDVFIDALTEAITVSAETNGIELT